MKKKYLNMPEQWRHHLIAYAVEYMQRGCSIRQYCRDRQLNQSTAKRYISRPMVLWLVDTWLTNFASSN